MGGVPPRKTHKTGIVMFYGGVPMFYGSRVLWGGDPPGHPCIARTSVTMGGEGNNLVVRKTVPKYLRLV